MSLAKEGKLVFERLMPKSLFYEKERKESVERKLKREL